MTKPATLGQLRESGVGDVMVGKHVGRLLSVLGGRLGAFREALAAGDETAFEAALERNTTMAEGRATGALAQRLMSFRAALARLDSDDIRDRAGLASASSRSEHQDRGEAHCAALSCTIRGQCPS